MNGGLIPRDYSEQPVGVSLPVYEGELVRRRDWPELIQMQSRLCSSAWHVHHVNRVPILNQGRFKYCWAYAVVAGVMNRYAFQGVNDPVSELSATAVAAQGKGYRNVGGHCLEAVTYCQRFGIPEAKFWPNDKTGRAYANDSDVEYSAGQNNVFVFEDCGDNFDAAVSAMLLEGVPVAFALPWWRHAVLGLRLFCKNTRRPERLSSYRLDFVNSYGATYGRSGYGSIAGEKMIGQEHIAIKSAKVKQGG